MIRRMLIVSTVSAILSLSAGPVFADNMQEPIYGTQLMTQQERNEYLTRIRAAKTLEEQEQIRMEHHELMKERAKAQGVTLPEEPPARGGGVGAGGGGMGSGGGSRGGGRGR